ncbi:cysteinyl leukotriene receptor 2 isoform X1 [Triplophysa rosa]|nr:cysteinyl leukotriene receptor 2 isoform X1 [Triplophysa rosa]
MWSNHKGVAKSAVGFAKSLSGCSSDVHIEESLHQLGVSQPDGFTKKRRLVSRRLVWDILPLLEEMNDSLSNLSGNASCEEGSTNDFKRIMYPVVYIIIFVLGSAGHSLSICVFFSLWRKQKSFTPVNLLMVNLLLSDLMMVCSLPLRISYYLLDKWPFGDVACRLIFYVFYLNIYISVYFLVALNILRYFALVWPYLYIRIQTSCVAGIVCAVIWLLMALASSPLFFSKKGKQEGSPRCLDLSTENVDRLLYINNVSLLMGFVVPLLVIIFCSIFVAKSLLTPSPALGRTRPCRKKACALVIISLGIFLVCFLPYHVVRTIFLTAEKQLRMNGKEDSCNYIWMVRKAAVITHCLCTTNSCLDPILFFFVGENFKSFSDKFLGRRKMINERTLRQEELQVLQK